MHSDQGRNFESKVFQEMLQILGIMKTRTTPLHLQSNGWWSNSIKTLEQHLSKFVDERQDDWDIYIPLFLMSYKGSIHASTDIPQQRCCLAVNFYYHVIYYLVFLEIHQSVLSSMYSIFNKIKINSDSMKKRYDKRANFSGFQESDLVWLYSPWRRKGRSPKLQRHWEGPYRIVKRVNDVVYRIQKSPRSKLKAVHVDRLHQYCGGTGTVRDEQV
uniref:Integrase catalytic domain-containing protein n=1 Tax=Biomphalaria glabrata TaxID=6526 RepID=A0A2C9LTM5_BIOGL